jgi:peptide/nickel transport system permease protein
VSSLLHNFFKKPQNGLGILIILGFVSLAIIAAVHSPNGQTPTLTWEQLRVKNQLDQAPQPPSSGHPLGTLIHQADILDGLIRGSRQALEFSLKAGLASAVIGVIAGAAGANLGGWINGLLLRFSDSLLAIPIISVYVIIHQLQTVMIAAIPGSGLNSMEGPSPLQSWFISFDALLWAIVLINWIPYARLTNARVTILKISEFVQAARALGAGQVRIIFRHLLPNAISPALVMLSRDLGWLVILQTSLQFAGFGGGSIWGDHLLSGRDWIIGAYGNPFGYWWVWLPGTFLIVLYGIGWNLVGDGLNDALNPYTI